MKHFDTSDRFSNHFRFFGPDFEQLGSLSQTNETIRHQIYSILTQNLILYVRSEENYPLQRIFLILFNSMFYTFQAFI